MDAKNENFLAGSVASERVGSYGRNLVVRDAGAMLNRDAGIETDNSLDKGGPFGRIRASGGQDYPLRLEMRRSSCSMPQQVVP